MEEGEKQEPPISKLFTIKRPMNKREKKDAPVAEKPSDCNGDRVTVSEFDCCVDNYFRAIETISKLCGQDDEDYYALQQTEIQRLSSSLTFLREWKYFNYEPRAVRFACEVGSLEGKDVVGGINLSQFSSATVPKEGPSGGATSVESRSTRSQRRHQPPSPAASPSHRRLPISSSSTTTTTIQPSNRHLLTCSNRSQTISVDP